MLTNCSTSTSDVAHQSNISVITDLPFSICFIQRPSSLVYFAFFVTCILLLLPVCFLVLWIGLKRRQQHRSTPLTTKMSHSDCFTYHLMAMNLIGVSGLILCCCGVFTLHVTTYSVGIYMFLLARYGGLFVHSLTCVEHFLAVVHHITYVSLKSERGVKIRNMGTGCVWLLSVGRAGVTSVRTVSSQLDFFLVTFTLVVISLCSLSVLYVLIRPRPGEQGADRERTAQTKKRAFSTIVVILGVVLLRCAWNITWSVLSQSGSKHCMIMSIGAWLNIPSIFVLPLLFLKRAGLITCCQKVK